MDTVVIGAGIAGLAAARQLADYGHRVTLLEAEQETGGRCRTHFWRGAWRIRGAYAFVTQERNLIEEARNLGIYEESLIEDRSEAHIFHILRDGRIHELRSLALQHLATTSLLSLREKAMVATAIPKMLSEIARSEQADDVTAYAHFVRASPAFADYVLEPVWGLFCGYDTADFSLAWLAYLLSQYGPNSNSWWTYKEGGVGRLTRALEARLAEHPNIDLKLGVTVEEVVEKDGRVEARWRQGDTPVTRSFDAAVVATPGPVAARMLHRPTPKQRAVLDRTAYAYHDVIFAYLDTPEVPRAPAVVLPHIEGYHCAANFEFARSEDGLLYVYGETKGDRGGLGSNADPGTLLDRFLADVYRFHPALAQAPVVDSYVQRNELALPTFRPGYLSAIKALREEGLAPRIELAGDYLLGTSVGSAHRTGLQAAEKLHKHFWTCNVLVPIT